MWVKAIKFILINDTTHMVHYCHVEPTSQIKKKAFLGLMDKGVKEW